eukprot:gene2405-8715_t
MLLKSFHSIPQSRASLGVGSRSTARANIPSAHTPWLDRKSARSTLCFASNDGEDVSPRSQGSSIPDSLPAMGADTDWREFRAKLVASGAGKDSSSFSSGEKTEWAHSIPVPEKGAVLVSHPMMFGANQTYFNKAVILLLDHDEGGSYGVILNRPSKYTLSEVVMTEPLPGFERSKLWIGGDVGNNQLLLLHRQAGMKGE